MTIVATDDNVKIMLFGVKYCIDLGQDDFLKSFRSICPDGKFSNDNLLLWIENKQSNINNIYFE